MMSPGQPPPDGEYAAPSTEAIALEQRLTAALPADHPLLPVVRVELARGFAEAEARGKKLPALPAGKVRRPWWTRWFSLVPLALAACVVFGMAAVKDLQSRPLSLEKLKWKPPYAGKLRPEQIDAEAPASITREGWYDETDLYERSQKIGDLSDKHPASAALYEAYAASHISSVGRLPPGFDEVTKRLEADNGIWPLFRIHPATKAMTRYRPPGSYFWIFHSTPELDAEFATAVRQTLDAPRLEHHLEEYEALCRAALHPSTYRTAAATDDRLYTMSLKGSVSSFSIAEELISSLNADAQNLRHYLRPIGPLLGRELIDGQKPVDFALDAIEIRHRGLKQEAELLEQLTRFPVETTVVPAAPPPGLWERIAETRYTYLRDPELEPRYYGARQVSETRLLLLAAGLICLAISLVLGLRLISVPAAPALLDRALVPLLRTVPLTASLVPVFAALPFVAGWWIYLHTDLDPDRLGMDLVLYAFMVCGLPLGILLQAARIFLGRRLAGTGMAAGTWQTLAGAVWVLPLAVAFHLVWRHHDLLFISQASLVVLGLVSLWWLGRLFFGYASPSSSVRHRLLARLLLPVTLTLALAASLGALALIQEEARLVDRTFHTTVHTSVTPETRQEIEAWMARWPK